MNKGMLLLGLLALSLNAQAKHLGTVGHTFEIIEEDLLASIQAKLKTLEEDGTLASHQASVQEKMLAGIQRPQAVAGLIRTQTPRIFAYDPSIRVPTDLKDHKNRIFAKAGTIINPLDTHAFSKKWLLIDGDDKAQLQWALKQDSSKIILVKGSPFALTEQYSKVFYFDQGGKFIKKFGIRQVPAQVFQTAKHLSIEEVLLEAQS